MYERSRSVGHLTSWASRLFARALERRSKDLGLSPGQIPVLLRLAEEKELTQKQLVQQCAIEQPAMAALLKRMEKSDLITRRTDARDGRASLISLNIKAHQNLEPLLEVLHRGNAEALSGFTLDEQEQLISMLRRLISNMARLEDAGREIANGQQ